jgi:hypothetical protein
LPQRQQPHHAANTHTPVYSQLELLLVIQQFFQQQ